MTDASAVRVYACLATVLAAALAVFSPVATAQAPQTTQSESALAAAAVEQAGSSTGPPATLTYANRPIIEFRSPLLGRPPAERVIAAQQAIDRLVESGAAGPVEVRTVDTVALVAVAGRDVFPILPTDVDALSGDTLGATAERAASRLRTALEEVQELRRPRQMLVSGVQVLLATAAFVGVLFAVWRARRAASVRLGRATSRRLRQSKVGDLEFVRSSRILEHLERTLRVIAWGLALLFGYWWLTFGLRRFPYTRPWGESLRAFLLDRLSTVAGAAVGALPGLFMVAVVVVITRFVARIMHLVFQAAEDGRITIPWVYPETARHTRKLATAGLWLFALAMAYPFLPGSHSQAFQGVSVFVGLVVSLGSSGLVNQVMSGFTLTYSRALRTGDFVAVGEVEGTVAQLGTLSTKIKTARGEDVTIPNAVMVSQTVTNYSRFADSEGVFVPTSITIGYDAPWRQVQALLLLAANRTPGVKRHPEPVVRQSSLQDFYVKYTLQFCLEQPATRAKTLAAVHANILDAFNEYGVQITSPNYEADPAAPKIVPKERWYAAPAVPDEPATSSEESAPGSPGPPRG